jgi:hypothetical protein
VVVKGESLWNAQRHTSVVVGRLDVECLAVVESRVIPLLVNAATALREQCLRNCEIESVFLGLSNGMFSTGVSCACHYRIGTCLGMCLECQDAEENNSERFVQVRCWDVSDCISEFNDWDDVGVSDAVGTHWVQGSEMAWLACPLEARGL